MENNSYKCVICGAENVELVDAVGHEEIISICMECAEKERLPIIHKATNEEISNIQRFYLSKGQEIQEKEQESVNQLIAKKSEEDKELEKIIRKNIKAGDYPELIDNFHWYIQQARRMKKISPKQLADSIAEPEVIIELAEDGKLPENHNQLINKLEQYLRIKIKKEIPKTESEKTESEKLIEEGIDLKKEDWLTTTTTYLKNLKEKMFSKPKELEESDEEIDNPESEKLKDIKQTEKIEINEEPKNKSERDLFEEYYKKID